MKKILLMFLFGTMTMLSQTTTVRGVTLSYNITKKLMTLTISPKTMYTNDTNLDVKIEINKEFTLHMTIGGVNYSVTQPYFTHSGHTRDMGWSFITYKPGGCNEIKNNYVYQFSDVKPGEEYILTVSDVCDEKYVSKEKTGSIQIR